MSAVFGREPSRPLPGAVEPDPVIDLRHDDHDEDALDVDDLDTEPEPEPVTEPEPTEPVIEAMGAVPVTEPEPVAEDTEHDADPEPMGAVPVTEPEPVAEDIEHDADLEPMGAVPVTEPERTEPVPGAEPEPEPPEHEPETDPEPVGAVLPAGPELVAEDGPAGAWDRRWDDLQATFVDDPRGAVDGAAALLSEALAETTPADAGTEDLRVGFRRYRAAFRDLHPTA